MDSVARPLLTGAHDQTAITLSRDDRWLAYVSSETGRELFFFTSANEMVAALFVTEPTFRVTDRRVLFGLGPGFVRDPTYTGYDISPDDRRFIMLRNVGAQAEVPT